MLRYLNEENCRRGIQSRCLTMMDNVKLTREPLIITKRGKPVAKLVPMDPAKDDFIGS